MNYFYAYLPNKKEKNIVVESVKSIPKEQMFIDENDQENKRWKDLISVLKKNDTLFIPSIDKISSEDLNLKDKLMVLKELDASLSTLDEEDLDIDTLLQLIDFVEEGRRKRVKKLQQEGIEKALEKKYKGEGAFGRPRAKVPEDFEENIKKIMRKELSHDSYRAELGMKRSTYYKMVKEVKDSWKQE